MVAPPLGGSSTLFKVVEHMFAFQGEGQELCGCIPPGHVMNELSGVVPSHAGVVTVVRRRSSWDTTT